jgi:hypothetical protein
MYKACGVLVLLAAVSSQAAAVTLPPVWGSVSWQVVMIGGNPYVDVPWTSGLDVYATPPNPDNVDLVGSNAFPTAYRFEDAMNDLVGFRVRVDGNPLKMTGDFDERVWTVFIDVNKSGLVEYALQLDAKTDGDVELVMAMVAGSPGSPWDPVTLSTMNLGSVTPLVGAWAEGVLAGDGSNFNGNADYFVDFAFPRGDFYSLMGLMAGDPIDVAFATSDNHENINKDLPDYSGFTPDDHVAPEPLTIVALAASGLGVGAYLRRRRKEASSAD